jgi:hypothetical protein
MGNEGCLILRILCNENRCLEMLPPAEYQPRTVLEALPVVA